MRDTNTPDALRRELARAKTHTRLAVTACLILGVILVVVAWAIWWVMTAKFTQ